jgi:glucose-6-phosphate dehydrogenase assembly protein OpcA
VRTCSEEVYLKVNGEGIPLVASLLTSFFVADVPRVLALPGDPIVPVLGGRELDWPFIRLFRRVLSVSDRVVFDSTRFKNFFHTVRLLLSSAEGQCDAEHEDDDDSALEHSVLRMLSDLQWERSERWRSLIAELFDATSLQELFGELSRVRLVSSSCSASAEAFLIGGWIVQALGLRVERAISNSEIVCTLPYGKEVVLDLRSGKAGEEEGLEQVTFVFGDRNRGEVECSVERDGGRGELSVIVLEPGPLTKTVRGSLRRVPFRRRTVEELFMQTMLAEGDVMFGASLLGAFRQAAVLEQVRRRGER